MVAIVWSTPRLVVNNQVINIIPGSLEFTEGLGEQSVKAQSSGGGLTELVISDNVETKISDVKFRLFSTPENIELVRTWKLNINNNVISATHTNGLVSRTFQNAMLTGQYTIQARPDGEIDLEFKCSPAI